VAADGSIEPLRAWEDLGEGRWKRRARLLARILAGSAALLPLLLWGGEVPGLRELSIILAGSALALAAWSLPRRWRLPPLAWIACAALPAAAVLLAQVWPGLGPHPWVAADAQQLGVTWTVRSIDPAATTSALGWVIGLAALAAATAILWPGERMWRLAGLLVVLGATHAALAIILAPLWGEFPSASASVGRVRGSFVYPNQAAACWAMLLPLALVLVRWRSRHYAWAAAALAAAVVLSASRGGTAVMLLIALPLLAVVIPARRRCWALPAILLVAGAWLWLVNLEPVQARYLRLEADASTLSGRLLIWRAAVPVAQSAGAFGCGAGTTELAWRRGGASAFEPSTVADLHSDPLQLWLELGWAGAAVVAAGLVAAFGAARWGGRLAENRPSSAGGGWRHPLTIGGGLGLLHLLLHGGAEYLMSSPALAAEAVLLAVVAARGLAGKPEGARIGVARWVLLVPATLAVAAGVGLLPRAAEERQARNLGKLDFHRVIAAAAVDREAAAKLHPGDPVPAPSPTHDPGFLASLRDRGPGAAHRLALVQARLWLDQAEREPRDRRGMWTTAAAAALAAAARDCPGSAAAWAERARLAALAPQPDPAAAAAALRRVVAWAPGWMRGHHLGIVLSTTPPTAAVVGPALGDLFLHLAIAAGRPIPEPLLDLMAARSGATAVAQLLDRAPNSLHIAAARWLRAHGSEAQWRNARRLAITLGRVAGLSDQLIAPTQALAAADLLGEGTWQLQLATSADGRKAQAVELLRAGLPIPPPLAAAVTADGGGVPGLDLPVPDLADREARAGLAAAIREAGPWAVSLRQDLDAVEQALVGDAASAAWAPPGTLLRLAEDTRLGASLGERLRQIAQRARRPTWRSLTNGTWCWWLDDGNGPDRVKLPPGRYGLVIDGIWRGWARDGVSVRTTPGVHRIVLLLPP